MAGVGGPGVEDLGTITGYVLAEDDSTTVVLVDDDRTVIRMASERIMSRTICRIEDSRSLLSTIVWKHSRLPRCAEADERD